MKNTLSHCVRTYGGKLAFCISMLASLAQAIPGDVQGHTGFIKGKPVFHETEFHGAFATIALKQAEPLVSTRSPFQKLEVYATENFGNMLVLDGVIQLTQFDNCAYHEMIVHVPMCAHPNPKRVLIIGGGDCGTLTQVLKYDSVEEVVMCEIDKKVVDLSREYFPEFAKAAKDPRATILYEDAAEYVKQKKNYYDVIIADTSDPIGPAVVLFEQAFYQDIKNALTKDGIAVTQSETFWYDKDAIATWHKRNKGMFKHAYYYFTLVPTYPSGSIGFSFLSKEHGPFDLFEKKKQMDGLKYYNKNIHRGSFQLPQFMKTALSEK